jgi:hypothetical protein
VLAFDRFVNDAIASYLSLFGPRHLFLSMVLPAVGTGLGFLWLFRLCSNQAALSAVKEKLQAHLLEFRLFSEEPALLWRSYKSLLELNMKYLALSLPSVLVAAVPLTILLSHFDCFYRWQPLPLGKGAVVTIQMKQGIGNLPALPQIEDAPGLAVETPAVRVFDQDQISWRIRPLEPISGVITIRVAGEAIGKEIRAGEGLGPISPRRTGSVLELLMHPCEARLESDAVAWVEVEYPGALIGPDGLKFHWLVWFSIISLVTAWLFRKRFGAVL